MFGSTKNERLFVASIQECTGAVLVKKCLRVGSLWGVQGIC